MIGKRNADPYSELRLLISNEISSLGLTGNECHMAFRNLGMNNIVTTNYDQIFESMFDVKKAIDNPGFSRNILCPVYKSQNIDFYHAHGLAIWKNTLCLGHEHYAALIGKIRNELYPNVDDEFAENLIALVMGKRDAKPIWPELLFATNVSIVGLSLDYSEIDLWWLLSMRAALFQPSKGLDKYANEITYYHIVTNARETSYERGKIAALEALGVQIRTVNSANYHDGYLNIAEQIKKSWFV